MIPIGTHPEAVAGTLTMETTAFSVRPPMMSKDEELAPIGPALNQVSDLHQHGDEHGPPSCGRPGGHAYPTSEVLSFQVNLGLLTSLRAGRKDREP